MSFTEKSYILFLDADHSKTDFQVTFSANKERIYFSYTSKTSMLAWIFPFYALFDLILFENARMRQKPLSKTNLIF